MNNSDTRIYLINCRGLDSKMEKSYGYYFEGTESTTFIILRMMYIFHGTDHASLTSYVQSIVILMIVNV